MNTILIGDVHGKVHDYKNLLKKYPGYKSIQLGDFGFKSHHEFHLRNFDSNKHKVLFGNHDDYTFLNSNHSCGNVWYQSNLNLMGVRGAYSIDQKLRVENRDWWRNEELNYNEMSEAIDFYAQVKPKIMISHDCPHSVRETIFSIHDKVMTANGLQSMLEIHKPKLWVFGHHHKSLNFMLDSVNFVCLSELEVFEIKGV